MARRKPPPRGPQLEIAGALAVAFVNTAGARDKNRQQGIRSYDELLSWGQQTGVVSALEAEHMGYRAAKNHDEAAAVFSRAVKLRSALFKLFLDRSQEKHLPREALAIVNEALSKALPAARIVPAGSGSAWGWAGDEHALDRMLWPVLHSAAEVLIDGQRHPAVRQCAARGCTLFFIDRSAAGNRKWCVTKICGNRTKALRHYYRSGKAQRAKKFQDLGLWREPGAKI